MWDDLREQVEVERKQLHQLLDSCRPLLEKCAASPPNDYELYALAAMLHSFYNGTENLFKRIAEGLDGQTPHGQAWHRELLDLMGQPGKARPAVISEGLVERLDAYLDFRHFFRHAYIFNLRWDRMKALVLGCEATLKLLEDQLDRFLVSDSGSGL